MICGNAAENTVDDWHGERTSQRTHVGRVYERRPTLQQHCTTVIAASAHSREEKHACWALSLGYRSARCGGSRWSQPSVPHARDAGQRSKWHVPSELPALAREDACARSAGRLRALQRTLAGAMRASQAGEGRERDPRCFKGAARALWSRCGVRGSMCKLRRQRVETLTALIGVSLAFLRRAAPLRSHECASER